MEPADKVEILSWVPPTVTVLQEYGPQPSDISCYMVDCIQKLDDGSFRKVVSEEFVVNSMSWLTKYPMDNLLDVPKVSNAAVKDSIAIDSNYI
jgi:hypothetical protein